jgi:hypothetical protein
MRQVHPEVLEVHAPAIAQGIDHVASGAVSARAGSHEADQTSAIPSFLNKEHGGEAAAAAPSTHQWVAVIRVSEPPGRLPVRYAAPSLDAVTTVEAHNAASVIADLGGKKPSSDSRIGGDRFPHVVRGAYNLHLELKQERLEAALARTGHDVFAKSL